MSHEWWKKVNNDLQSNVMKHKRDWREEHAEIFARQREDKEYQRLIDRADALEILSFMGMGVLGVTLLLIAFFFRA